MRQVRSKPGFTLIELLTVIAILAILLAMLLPTLGLAREQGNIGKCTNILQNMGVAFAHYASDNQNYLPPSYWTDWRWLQFIHDNWGWQYEYQANYNYHNLIAPYLGLGNCMPGTPHWGDAAYSGFKEFRCPSGEGKLSPYDPYPYNYDDNGNQVWPGSVSNFYCHNTLWTVQPADGKSILAPTPDNRLAWAANVPKPQFAPYTYTRGSVPTNLFTDPDKAIMLFERWTCNGEQPEPMTFALPYSAHYRSAPGGVACIGRNALYIDWHVKLLPWANNDVREYDWSSGWQWYWAWDINYNVCWPG